MHTATAHLRSISPYSQGKYHNLESLDKEAKDDYERRTWKGRLHVNEEGNVVIPPMAFKNMLSEAARYLGIQIPGKGKSTYTKHFEAGVMVVEPMVLPVNGEDVQGEWLYVPSDGKRGGSKRVMRCFPIIHSWSGTVAIHVLDDTITKDVLLDHLQQGGQFIGIGRFRPRNNGYYGRFEVSKLEWK